AARPRGHLRADRPLPGRSAADPRGHPDRCARHGDARGARRRRRYALAAAGDPRRLGASRVRRGRPMVPLGVGPTMSDVTTAQTRPGDSRAPESVWQRLPLPTERALRGLAIASLISPTAIIVTGGAVRLTGSGLGCPEWPRCTPESYTVTPEMGIHGAVEFGNRLLTFVLGVIAALMLAAVLRTLRSSRPRRDLLIPSVILLLGIPAQAVIGGVTVWTALNPWVVMLHFTCSAVLVGVATVLVRRAQRPLGRLPQPIGSPWL